LPIWIDPLPGLGGDILIKKILSDSSLNFADDVTRDCTDIEKLNRIEQEVIDMIEQGRSLGFNVAASRLEYWLSGLGGDNPFDVDWLRSNEHVLNAEQINLDRFITGNGDKDKSLRHKASALKDGDILQGIKDYWIKDTTITLPTSDFELAVGTFKLKSMGNFRMHRKGEEVLITGIVRHLFKDKYDFNPGDVFFVPGYTKNGIRVLVHANELNLLLHCRNAKNFIQDTCWEQNLEAIVKFPINEFRWNILATSPILEPCSDVQMLEKSYR
jgi:hypothetical protein